MTISIAKKLFKDSTIIKKILIFLVVTAFTGGCGYYNPNMLPDEGQGGPVYLYIPIWPNPTAEVGVENQIHNALSDWFIQSKRIILTNKQEDADYRLTGTIDSINFPGRSYTATDQATALKAQLTVSFKMEDIKNSFVILQRNSMTLEESYTIGATPAEEDDNKQKALQTITDDLAEEIYLRTIISLRRYDRHRESMKKSHESSPADSQME